MANRKELEFIMPESADEGYAEMMSYAFRHLPAFEVDCTRRIMKATISAGRAEKVIKRALRAHFKLVEEK